MLRSPDTFNPQIRLPSAQSTSDQAERWETRSVRFCWFLARVRLVRFTEWPSRFLAERRELWIQAYSILCPLYAFNVAAYAICVRKTYTAQLLRE